MYLNHNYVVLDQLYLLYKALQDQSTAVPVTVLVALRYTLAVPAVHATKCCSSLHRLRLLISGR